jgi:D,D-heptose 1,7-bisphosphate phosphatase
LKKYDTVFLDRDGTLNFDPGYINHLEQFEFYNFTIPALIRMAIHGYRFCIVTNQSGIARGLIKKENLEEIHAFIREQFRVNDIRLLDIYYCGDHPNKESDRRKPQIGMFLEAAEDHNIDLKKCIIIGDDVADILVGQRLKMDTMLVLTGRGNLTQDTLPDGVIPTFTVDNLMEGAKLLEALG